ncbi:hypothetical protein IAD21_03088 [Abditibacteriota bacterium]|nr:hypothetical protein IAD21_03088 [Abditibacteriota bacterium]
MKSLILVALVSVSFIGPVEADTQTDKQLDIEFENIKERLEGLSDHAFRLPQLPAKWPGALVLASTRRFKKEAAYDYPLGADGWPVSNQPGRDLWIMSNPLSPVAQSPLAPVRFHSPPVIMNNVLLVKTVMRRRVLWVLGQPAPVLEPIQFAQKRG